MARATRTAGFTLIELLMVVAVIGILAALAVPFLITAKASGNEASAIGSLRAINTAQSSYSSACGWNHYSASMVDLISSGFLSPDLGFSPKSGYNFALQPGAGAVAGPLDCAGQATLTGYYASGTPLSAIYGTRGFATNVQGTIWQDTTGVPPAEPFTPGATVSPIQ
jgi:prepilin-type N-terminal cleavage/methylation domain-containing protein